jgi:hypothetical protein
MKASTDPTRNWMNNAIQFPRLIAELEAVGVFQDASYMGDLAESMDLGQAEIAELVERAVTEFDKIKS